MSRVTRGFTARRSDEPRRSRGPSTQEPDRQPVCDAGVTPRGPQTSAPRANTYGTGTDPNTSVRLGPVRLVSMLLGAATCMVITGLAAEFHRLFADTTLANVDATSTIVGVALLALAIGIRLPQGVAVWVCAVAWRRFVSRGRLTQILPVPLDPGGADRPLYWVVLSVIALAGGLLTALLPVGLGLADAAYQGMLERFLWSSGPLVVLQSAVAFVTALVPLAVFGLALSCAHHLSCPAGRWETRATAWALIGGTAGLLLANAIIGQTGRGDLTLFTGALPVLLIALVSAASSSSRADESQGALNDRGGPLPISSDRWPTLLRASIVVVAGGGAWGITVGAHHARTMEAPVCLLLVALLFAMGLGVLAGCRRRRSGFRSIGGFGVTCAAAGAVVAAASLGVGRVVSVDRPAAGVLLFAGVWAIGLSMAYGRQTLLSRVANRSSAGAKVLARTLVWSALVVWMAAPLAVRLAGTHAALLVLGLSLLALGGTLIIHEPSYAPRTRRIRLCAVFGCIGFMIVVFLWPSRERRSVPWFDRVSAAMVSIAEPTVATPAADYR